MHTEWKTLFYKMGGRNSSRFATICRDEPLGCVGDPRADLREGKTLHSRVLRLRAHERSDPQYSRQVSA